MAEPIEIHASDVTTFHRCRRKWFFSSPLKLNYRPRKERLHFLFGSIMHEALAEHYQHRSMLETFEKRFREEGQRFAAVGMFQEEEQEISDLFTLGLQICRNYVKKYGTVENEPFEVLEVESDFKVKLLTPEGNPSRGMHAGRIDMLVLYEGGLWVVEHKNYKSFSDGLEIRLVLDYQAGAYLAALREQGVEDTYKAPLRGCIFNVLRRDVPEFPQVLKNGSLSKNVRQDTTYELYVQKMEELGVPLTAPDYQEMLDILRNKPDMYFRRYTTFRTTEEIDEIRARMYEEYRDMTNPKIYIYPSPTWDCTWDCSFRDACIAMSSGGDYKSLLEAEFVKREGAW